MPQLIITAVGPDRPGLVGEITGHLHSAGGNILDSRMVNLRGQFALVLLMEAAEGVCLQVGRSIEAVGTRLGLRVQAIEQKQPQLAVGGVPFKLKTYSQDQPGIVHRVTDLLQRHGVNIEELSTRQESAAFAGSPLFLMEMRLTVPASVKLRQLRGELESLCDSLNCDVDLDPA